MPEGHVLHRLADSLNQQFSGQAVQVVSPQGRFAVEAERLDTADFLRAEAVGKQLFVGFDVPEPAWIHIHLGLIGAMRLEPLAEPWGEVRLRIANGEVAADLRGPQWCRMVTSEQMTSVISTLGPDPLRDDADPARGYRVVSRSQQSIAALLMNQKVAAGVGNIFRAEVLYRLGLRPTTPGHRITPATWDAIWQDLRFLMRRAVDRGRIDTVRDPHLPDAQGRPPREDPHGGEVYVYRRAGMPCLVCGCEVKTSMLQGRRLYWCGSCQRRTHAVPTDERKL